MLRYGLWLGACLALLAGCGRPAKTEKKAAAPAAAATIGSEAEQRAAHYCVEEWQNEMYYRERTRMHTASEKARGHRGVPDDVQKTRDQAVMARFMPACERFGFAWPPIIPVTAAGEGANNALAARLETEVEKYRRGAEQAWQKSQEQQEQQRTAERRADQQEDCRKAAEEIARARAQVEALPAADREVGLRNVERAEAGIRKECG